MNKRQDLTITDLYGHFSNVLFNIEVTNNLHPFFKTLTESRVISSHFQRPCTMQRIRFGHQRFPIGSLNLKDRSALNHMKS